MVTFDQAFQNTMKATVDKAVGVVMRDSRMMQAVRDSGGPKADGSRGYWRFGDALDGEKDLRPD